MQVDKRSFRFLCGHVLREFGESMSNAGCWLQGSMAHKERLNRTRRVMNFTQHQPTILSTNDTFIAPNASVIGQVTLGPKSSIWYGTVVRGDVGAITIGSQTALMDRVVVHVNSNKNMETKGNTVIGDNVVVEAGSIIHAATIGNSVYVGAQSTVLDGATIGDFSIIGPGSVVTPNTHVPPGQLWTGTPAKFVRELTEQEMDSLAKNAVQVQELALVHNEECSKEAETVEREILKVQYKEDKLAQYVYVPPRNAE